MMNQDKQTEERAAFETWWKGDLVDWRGHQSVAAAHAWDAWQARAALSSAPAREPMTDAQVEPMFRARKAAPTKGVKDEWYWYSWGVEDAERHHSICKE